jgi:hypothetical protein
MSSATRKTKYTAKLAALGATALPRGCVEIGVHELLIGVRTFAFGHLTQDVRLFAPSTVSLIPTSMPATRGLRDCCPARRLVIMMPS